MEVQVLSSAPDLRNSRESTPKETWSLITWFVYAIFLHTRLVKGWKGKKAAIIAIIGFVAVIFTYFGVNLIGGLHSY